MITLYHKFLCIASKLYNSFSRQKLPTEGYLLVRAIKGKLQVNR